ncbi:MAG: Lrp/AsnC family transcriptional regulator [Acidimicrobiia bacterium]
MAVTAYLLIQTEVGKAAHVVEAIRDLDGVVSADDVTGPYDVIVVTKADSIDDLGKMVVSKIQAVDGITRTLTCPVVRL